MENLGEAEIGIQQIPLVEAQVDIMVEQVAKNQPNIVSQDQNMPQDQNIREPVYFQHLEINDDELMNDDEMQNQAEDQDMEWQQDDNVIVNNINVGMVRIEDCFYASQPCLNKSFPPPLTTIRPDLLHNKTVLEIPKEWANFFKVLLGSPSHFEWAKKLLQTVFPSLLQQIGDLSLICLLDKCSGAYSEVYDKLKQHVSSSLGEDNLCFDHSTPTTPQTKKRIRKPKSQSPIVESEVRRSSRVRERCNGFKTSQCKVANYLGCSMKPPNMTADLLKKIGSSICQILLNQLEEEEALSMKKKIGSVGNKKSIGKPSQDDEEDKKNKKPNKDVEED